MIPVGILTYQRPDFFRQTLESFIRLNYVCLDRFILLVLVQNVDDETQKVIDEFAEHLHTVVYGENEGCAAGYNKIMEICLSHNTPLVMHLQDDWLSTEPLTHYLGLIEKMFEKHQDIGYIRLRSIKEHVKWQNRISKEWIDIKFRESVFKKADVELHREGKFLPVDEPYGIKSTDLRGTITMARIHFTFNPTIIRNEVLSEVLPFTKELDAMKKFHDTGLYSAQLEANCFRHIGLERAYTLTEEGKVRFLR